MDRIILAQLNDFANAFEIESLSASKQFEYFTTYTMLRRHYSDTFDLGDIIVGDGNDTGLDAVAIIVNGDLITDLDVFRDKFKPGKELDVQFLFIQAETSSSFDGSKIGTFGFGVQDFFKFNSHTLPRNTSVSKAAKLSEAIYERSADFRGGNPCCRMYYVTTGKWTNDHYLQSRLTAVVADLEMLNLFDEVLFTPIDATVLQRSYRQTKDAVSNNFVFTDKIVMPDVAGVKEAYLGYLPAKELVKLLADENNVLRSNLFDENVRDFQGDNRINAEIDETLRSQHSDRFVLMNNGVTIIAANIQVTGNRFHIEDYQIVNGCQTSNVIFNNKKNALNAVSVPIRLIGTTDDEVISSIIRATNRQTAVKEDQFIALQDFSKKLELYFASFPEQSRLYYERRSCQYTRSNIKKNRIITQSNLVRSTAAMFLSEPHRTTRNYAGILSKVGKDFFVNDDKLDPYYAAALGWYKIELLLNNKKLDPKYRPARFHMLLALRLLCSSSSLPQWNSKNMEKYCEPIIKLLVNQSAAEVLINKTTEIIDDVAHDDYNDDTIRTERFTREVTEKSKKLAKTKAIKDCVASAKESNV